MPASPEITVEVNPAKLLEVVKQLELKRVPTITITPAKDNRTRGDATPAHIRIFFGLTSQEANRLLFVTNQITRTLLHELRHAHQFETWTDAQWAKDERYSYGIKPSEEDARDFADSNVAKYRGLVKVRRRQASPLGRLNKAERISRQRV